MILDEVDHRRAIIDRRVAETKLWVRICCMGDTWKQGSVRACGVETPHAKTLRENLCGSTIATRGNLAQLAGQPP